ncbi:hypothetical protein O181_017454 [Austropuccinia psidii MF-1]|uniref:glucan 1,3-beta-glucosidase n=1 Tax=Austropuccinia psidii MF-1 TaxID=1389203 RepID=A0A9Q3C5R9_9BASI|nr:hypothetical protein [Austropuccinia psidii MF-1]
MLNQTLKSRTAGSNKLPLSFLLLGSICSLWIIFSLNLLKPQAFPSFSETILSKRAFRNENIQKRGLGYLPRKPKWDFDKDKIVGLSLGNWLVLERWMSEDWFTTGAGPNTWDEWGFSKALGPKARAVLEEHWSRWFTEADVARAHRAGINTFRVPIGFWMMIKTVPPEPYVTQGQLAYLEKLCHWAYVRNMYVILDLHGLPGSQNGEQQSGHNTTLPTFFQPLQQARSDQFVKAVVDWVAQSPYYSIISAIEVVNEPRPYTTEQRAMLRAFYERSYTTIQTLGNKAPVMLFADGYVPGDKLAYWWDFAASHRTSPTSLALADHPYPGFFPANGDHHDVLNQVCTKGAKYANFPVTTVITEWSLRSGIQDSKFEKVFYEAQLRTWTWYSGAVFWSLRNLASKAPVLADKIAPYQWSFETLLDRGVVTLPANEKQSTHDFLASLHTPCGPRPQVQRNGPKPTGPEAEKAITSAQAAKAMIDGINKSVEKAAQSFGLVGSGSRAVWKKHG